MDNTQQLPPGMMPPAPMPEMGQMMPPEQRMMPPQGGMMPNMPPDMGQGMPQGMAQEMPPADDQMSQESDMWAIQPPPVDGGAPYFMGEHALVKFASMSGDFGPETYWLVDKNDKTLRPFESENALKKAFGDGYSTAKKHVVVVSAPNINSDGDVTDGVLEGFSVLSPEYAVKEDGSAKKLDFSSHQLKQRYGKPINEDAEETATNELDSLFQALKNKPGGASISIQELSKMQNDSKLMAHYISAMAYGGYTIDDVYNDMAGKAKK